MDRFKNIENDSNVIEMFKDEQSFFKFKKKWEVTYTWGKKFKLANKFWNVYIVIYVILYNS